MRISFDTVFWPDSELEKIEIVYDKITIKILDHLSNRKIEITCEQCVGMTEIMTWDEVIIEDVTINDLHSKTHSLLDKTSEIYGDGFYDSIKSLKGNFYELCIKLINNVSFSVVCKNITLNE